MADTATGRGSPASAAAAARRFTGGRPPAASTAPARTAPSLGPRHARAEFHRGAAGDVADTVTGVPVSKTAAGRKPATKKGTAPARRGRARVAGQRVSMDFEREAYRQFRSTSRVLIVEWVLVLALIVLKPSEPAPTDDGTAPASESTIPQLIAVSLVFLLLAAIGAAGPRPQRFANLFGGLVALALAFKNHGQLSAAVTSLTTAKKTPAPAMAPATDQETTQTLPTPTGQPTFNQAVVSGWRGAAPSSSASNPYRGGISGRP